jgi:hypothetical protein
MTKADHTLDTTLTKLDRLRNSTNGNPRYRLITEVGAYYSAPDHEFAIGLSPSVVGSRVRLHLSNRFKVVDLEVLQ